MEELLMNDEKDQPYVRFNKEKGIFHMGGSSLPEDVVEVFIPILKWLEEYAKEPNKQSEFEFFFEYLNTASSKMMMRVSEILGFIATQGNEVNVKWQYMAGDYDMKDLAFELMEHTICKLKVIEADILPLPKYKE